MDDILEVTLRVAEICDRLELPYVIGGSLASSLHGIPRSTLDVDVVVRLTQEDVAPLIAAFGADFYLDEAAIRDAVARGTSFNLISLASYLKADVFVAKDDEVSRLQLARAQRYPLGDPPRTLAVASAEDVVAQKLHWFALGDRVSERQWSDALGVLKVAGPRLDLVYLRRVSRLIGVEDVLRDALAEAGLEPSDT